MEKSLDNYRSDIDGLRALSIIFILFYHLDYKYFFLYSSNFVYPIVLKKFFLIVSIKKRTSLFFKIFNEVIL